jgi:hypothetical protein
LRNTALFFKNIRFGGELYYAVHISFNIKEGQQGIGVDKYRGHLAVIINIRGHTII